MVRSIRSRRRYKFLQERVPKRKKKKSRWSLSPHSLPHAPSPLPGKAIIALFSLQITVALWWQRGIKWLYQNFTCIVEKRNLVSDESLKVVKYREGRGRGRFNSFASTLHVPQSAGVYLDNIKLDIVTHSRLQYSWMSGSFWQLLFDLALVCQICGNVVTKCAKILDSGTYLCHNDEL